MTTLTTKIPEIIRNYLKKHNKRNTEVNFCGDEIGVYYRIGDRWCKIIAIHPHKIVVQTEYDEPTETMFERMNDVFKALGLNKVGWCVYPAGHQRKTWRFTTTEDYWDSYKLYSKRKYSGIERQSAVFEFTLRNLMHLLNTLSKTGGVHPYTGESLQNVEIDKVS